MIIARQIFWKFGPACGWIFQALTVKSKSVATLLNGHGLISSSLQPSATQAKKPWNFLYIYKIILKYLKKLLFNSSLSVLSPKVQLKYIGGTFHPFQSDIDFTARLNLDWKVASVKETEIGQECALGLRARNSLMTGVSRQIIDYSRANYISPKLEGGFPTSRLIQLHWVNYKNK